MCLFLLFPPVIGPRAVKVNSRATPGSMPSITTVPKHVQVLSAEEIYCA